MKFEIRELKIEDAKYIYKLNCKEMGYEISLEETQNNLKKLLNSDKDKIFVAVKIDENSVEGYVHATDYNLIYSPPMKNIMGIAVNSSYKKCGIGRALLSAVEQWGEDTGAFAIRLSSGITRTDAHEFYMHCGYEGGKQQLKFVKEL